MGGGTACLLAMLLRFNQALPRRARARLRAVVLAPAAVVDRQLACACASYIASVVYGACEPWCLLSHQPSCPDNKQTLSILTWPWTLNPEAWTLSALTWPWTLLMHGPPRPPSSAFLSHVNPEP